VIRACPNKEAKGSVGELVMRVWSERWCAGVSVFGRSDVELNCEDMLQEENTQATTFLRMAAVDLQERGARGGAI
jgi:hypothetical protein